MKHLIKKKAVLFFFLTVIFYYNNAYASITILSAQNIYGNVAKELGGPYVKVINVLNSPNQDPHLFNFNPRIAKIAATANIIIMNGANYDPWMYSLLPHQKQSPTTVIIIANLIKPPDKNNPPLWYLPSTMPIFAQYLVKELTARDPAHQAFYEQKLFAFNLDYKKIFAAITQLKHQYDGRSVIATEPLFNYMAQDIGLKMQGTRFQLSIMNDLPPSISDVKAFEDHLHRQDVSLLFYNNQILNPMTKRMLAIALKQNIPIIGLNEIMPNNISYVSWMLGQLALVDKGFKMGKQNE